jgi:cytochrome c-type biogenesis protein
MSIAFAFVVGLITFVDPCVIATVPVYLAYLTGHRPTASDTTTPVSRSILVGRTLFFIAGFSTLFLSIGALVVAIGRSLEHVIPWMFTIGALLTIVIGFALLCACVGPLTRLSNLIARVVPTVQSPTGAYTLGLSMAVAWIPCVGPIMAAIVALATVTQQVTQGFALLVAYVAGLALPFLLTAFGTDWLLSRLRNLGRVVRVGTAVAGVALMLIGVLVLTHGYERVEHYVSGFYETKVPALYGWREEAQYEEWWETWFTGKEEHKEHGESNEARH